MELLDLAYDHRNAIGGKADRLGDVKIINGLDQADAADLEQIVSIFPPAHEFLNDRQHQAQVAFDQFLAGLLIAFLGAFQQSDGFCIFQNL